MRVRHAVSLYLLASGVLLAGFSLRSANGEAGPGLLLPLADTHVGIYRRADATLMWSGYFVDRDGNAARAGSSLDLIDLLGSDELTVRQPPACLSLEAARGCNLPFLQLSLGRALALAALLLTAGAAVRWWARRRRAAAAALGFGLLLAGWSLLAGSANDLQPDRTPAQNAGAARIGIYRQAYLPSDREMRNLVGRDLFSALNREGPLRFRQPHACYQPRPQAGVCHEVLNESPLWLGALAVAALAGLAGLAGGALGRPRRPAA